MPTVPDHGTRPLPRADLEVVDTAPPEHLFRRMVGAYLGGAGLIVVHEGPRLTAVTRTIVGEFERRAVGVRESRTGTCEVVIACSPATAPASLKGDVDRFAARVLSFHRTAVGSWGQLPFQDEDGWRAADDALDAEAWLLQRRIAVSEQGNSPEIGREARARVRALQRIADEAVELGGLCQRLQELPSGDPSLRALRALHELSLEHLSGALRAETAVGANELLDVGEALLASARTLDRSWVATPGTGTRSAALASALGAALRAVVAVVGQSQEVLKVLLERPAAENGRRSPPSKAAALSTGL